MLIWGIEKYRDDEYMDDAAPVNRQKARQAAAFVRGLERADAPAILPSPAISEYITGLERDLHEPHLQLLNKHARVVPFDDAAAYQAGRMMSYFSRNYRDRWDQEKPYVKADAMIGAIAEVQGASMIFTHDKGFEEVMPPDTSIRVAGIDEIEDFASGEQQDLFS